MEPSILGGRAGGMAIAGLVLALGSGCARTVELPVMRPAMMNLQPEGGTVSVGTIRPNGHLDVSAELTANLRQRIANSLNPSIRLLVSGGAVIVDGSVLVDGYETHTETVSQTCSKTVDDGTDSNGNAQSHTETYDCSYSYDVGNGVSQIELRVLRAGGKELVFDRIYAHAGTLSSASAEDATRLMHGLRDAAVAEFAKTILPWREVVTERFKDCDGDARCKRGFELVKAGDLRRADALFTEVIGDHAVGFVPEKLAKPIGEALYDRGVTRAYQQRYDDAEADLLRAVALQPGRRRWPAKLDGVRAMARDWHALREQGAVP